MIHQCYAIFDAAAGAYLPPFHLPRDGMAIRAFADCVNSPNHQFNQHPKDYTLFHLGQFDDSTGVYENRANGPIPLAPALSLIAPKVPDRNTLDLIDNPPAKGNGFANEGMQ